jgi:TonB family protein
MNGLLIIALALALLGSHCAFANSSPSSAKHCSAEKGSTELPYPESLRGSGIQGNVLIEAVIGENGCTESVRVVRKLHPQLDRIAKDAVKSWKFQPALKDGKPVKVLVQIGVEFRDTNQQH